MTEKGGGGGGGVGKLSAFWVAFFSTVINGMDGVIGRLVVVAAE
jgi:hypothetical protein